MIRLLLAVAVTALVAPGAAEAASALAPCPGKPNVQCGTVDVPLDRTGMIAGRVSLYAENLPASGRPRGVMFLIAGGPGQASTRAFDLAESGDYYQALFPGYTLVAFDPRGTGRSGVLSCRGLQTTADADPDTFARLAAECATQIGPARVAYATRDHAEDIEAVRQALGLDRIALWGTSYGTKLAVAYALAHPERVERLLLDSVVLPESDDTFDTDTLRAIPGALGSICAGSLCRGVTANLGADVARLANRLAASPIRGPVVQTNGRGVVERVDGLRLLSIVVDADLSPGIAAELPAAVAAALRGRNQPLLRLAQLDEGTFAVPDTELSFGLLAATNCADGRFPWSPTTPIAQRQAIFDAAVAALPAGLRPGRSGPGRLTSGRRRCAGSGRSRPAARRSARPAAGRPRARSHRRSGHAHAGRRGDPDRVALPAGPRRRRAGRRAQRPRRGSLRLLAARGAVLARRALDAGSLSARLTVDETARPLPGLGRVTAAHRREPGPTGPDARRRRGHAARGARGVAARGRVRGPAPRARARRRSPQRGPYGPRLHARAVPGRAGRRAVGPADDRRAAHGGAVRALGPDRRDRPRRSPQGRFGSRTASCRGRSAGAASPRG